MGAKLLLSAQSSPQWQTVGENRLLLDGQEVIVIKLRNFLDIIHFFAYCNHILLVLQYGYETGQAATHIKIVIPVKTGIQTRIYLIWIPTLVEMTKQMRLPYDKNLIGRLLAFGAENVVYFYNYKKEVIKFPAFFSIRYLWSNERYCRELTGGFETLKKYIPQNLNQSQIYFYEQSGKQKYAIIEPFISGAALTKKDLFDKALRNQFLEIIKAKKILEEEERIFIDLFGSWGLWISGRRQIPNLLLERNTGKIYLVDIGTAKIDDDRFFIRILVRLANKIQNSLLKLYI